MAIRYSREGRPPVRTAPPGTDMWARTDAGALWALRALGQIGDTRERLEIVHREVGEHLAIDLHSGALESRHEAAVAHSLGPGRGVDASDPEGAELSLLLSAVAVGVAHRAFRGLLGRLVELAAAAASALGGLHDLLFSGVVGDTVFDAGHGLSLRLKEAADAGKVRRADQV